MTPRAILTRLSCAVLLLALTGPDLPAQTAATTRVMRDKLTHSQKVLESILTSDFRGLEEHADALVKLTTTEGWAVLKSVEYQRRSAAFVLALNDLTASARQKDLDTAAIRYMAMTLACFECHRTIKNSRLARLQAPFLRDE